MSRDVFLLLLGMYGEYNMSQAIEHDASMFPSEGWAYLCTQGRSWASMVCMLSVFTLFATDQVVLTDISRTGRMVTRIAALLSYVGVFFFLLVSIVCESVTLYATYSDEMEVGWGLVLYGLTTALFVSVNLLMLYTTTSVSTPLELVSFETGSVI